MNFISMFLNTMHNLWKSATGAGKPGSPNLFGQIFMLTLDFSI